MLLSRPPGFNTGKGEKQSNSQAACLSSCAWLLLISPFPFCCFSNLQLLSSHLISFSASALNQSSQWWRRWCWSLWIWWANQSYQPPSWMSLFHYYTSYWQMWLCIFLWSFDSPFLLQGQTAHFPQPCLCAYKNIMSGSNTVQSRFSFWHFTSICQVLL